MNRTKLRLKILLKQFNELTGYNNDFKSVVPLKVSNIDAPGAVKETWHEARRCVCHVKGGGRRDAVPDADRPADESCRGPSENSAAEAPEGNPRFPVPGFAFDSPSSLPPSGRRVTLRGTVPKQILMSRAPEWGFHRGTVRCYVNQVNMLTKEQNWIF